MVKTVTVAECPFFCSSFSPSSGQTKTEIVPTEANLVEFILSQTAGDITSTPRVDRSSTVSATVTQTVTRPPPSTASSVAASLSVTPLPAEVIVEESKLPLAIEVSTTLPPTSHVFPRSSTASTIHTDCDVPYLDFVFVLDRSERAPHPDMASNRFLLLDVLGSLVANPNIRVAIVSFAETAKTEAYFTNTMHKGELFKAVEKIETSEESSNYAAGGEHALRVLNEGGRADARAVLVFFGDGSGEESVEERTRTAQRIRNTAALVSLAVDASSRTQIHRLAHYTTSGTENVYDFERNTAFIDRIEKLASADRSCDEHMRIFTASPFATDHGHLARLFKDLAAASDDLLDRQDKIVSIPITTTRRHKFTTTLPRTTERVERIPIRTTRSLIPATEELVASTTTQRAKVTTTIPFRPGCILDVMFVMDTSGSVGKTFDKEKELAKQILHRFRIGPKNAKVAIVKFASTQKVKIVHSFSDNQTEPEVFAAFDSVGHTSGTTALHTALSTAAEEFQLKARHNIATQVAMIFTDGFGEKDLVQEAALLREQAQYVYAVAIEHHHPINFKEMVEITGEEERVFTDANIDELENLVTQHSRGCKERFEKGDE